MRVAACALLGIFVGMIGALLQSYTVRLGDVHLPVGMFAVLVTVVLVARSVAWWVGSRWGAIAFSIGWLGATLIMGAPTGIGDLVLPAGPREMAYITLGTILLSACCGFPLLPLDPDRPGAPRPAVGADG